jgi:HD-GYP domain-containing protein (c-di-GMP phosphodiesterase class II)
MIASGNQSLVLPASARTPAAAWDPMDLADALEVTAGRFRAAGMFLALLDESGRVALADESSPAETRTAALTLLAQHSVASLSIASATVAGVSIAPIGSGWSLAVVSPAYNSGGPGGELLVALADAVRATLLDHVAGRDRRRRLDDVTAHLADTYEELTLLYHISSSMRVNHALVDYFRGLCEEVVTVLGARVVGAALRPGRSCDNSLVVHGNLDLDPERLSRFIYQTMEILIDRATGTLPSRGPMLINNVRSDPNYSYLHPHISSLLVTPLVRDEQLLGFLFAVDRNSGVRGMSPMGLGVGGVLSAAPGGFDSVDAKLLSSVAGASAVYMENALLFDDTAGLTMGLMHSLTAAVDAKDSYTCGHSQRVAILSRLLAQTAGFSSHDTERVYMSGLLHDVGKIGVPEAVLQKCGKLTAEEFEAMKKHPEIGARILADVRQVQDLIPGVLHHHERYDGRGYPHGLVGEDIPILGRVICLADSFDAMTTNRTYRRGMPLQQAMDEIQRCAGTQFDPKLAQLFVSLGVERIDSILEEHRVRAATAVAARTPTAQAA